MQKFIKNFSVAIKSFVLMTVVISLQVLGIIYSDAAGNNIATILQAMLILVSIGSYMYFMFAALLLGFANNQTQPK